MTLPTPLQHSFALLLPLPLPVYAGAQSALHPVGDDAVQIAKITWVLVVGGSLIFLMVMVLALIALFGKPAQRSALARRSLIIGGGIAFPVVALSGLLIYSFMAAATMIQKRETPAARIEVAGELWWWRVRYLDQAGTTLFETANEIRIPAERPVELLLRSENVIHSFWVPNLAGKIDMVPGHVNKLRIQANTPGVFRGQCAEYCGAQHAKMAFEVVAHTVDEYDAWLAAQTGPAQAPREPVLQHGMQLFLQNGCAKCHTIRGTPATGKFGPDLTHVGSRRWIGAGLLPNSTGTLAAWIISNQQLKPENKMPAFGQFSGAELGALAAYLESLR